MVWCLIFWCLRISILRFLCSFLVWLFCLGWGRVVGWMGWSWRRGRCIYCGWWILLCCLVMWIFMGFGCFMLMCEMGGCCMVCYWWIVMVWKWVMVMCCLCCYCLVVFWIFIFFLVLVFWMLWISIFNWWVDLLCNFIGCLVSM